MKSGSAVRTLGQIGRTGLLVAPLGVLIYCGESRVAGIDGAQLLLAIILCLPLTMLCPVHVPLALCSGGYPYGKT